MRPRRLHSDTSVSISMAGVSFSTAVSVDLFVICASRLAPPLLSRPRRPPHDDRLPALNRSVTNPASFDSFDRRGIRFARSGGRPHVGGCCVENGQLKLVVIIASDPDAEKLTKKLIDQGYPATKISSTGGFLPKGNATILSRVEAN